MSASLLALSSTAAFAEGTLSVYGGASFSPHSSVTYNDGVNADLVFYNAMRETELESKSSRPSVKETSIVQIS